MKKIIIITALFGSLLTASIAQTKKAMPAKVPAVAPTTAAATTPVATAPVKSSTSLSSANSASTATMQTTTEQVEIRPAYTEKEVIPATYTTVTEQVLKKEAGREGAVYATATEQVMASPASKRLELTPIIWEAYPKQFESERPCTGAVKTNTIQAQRIRAVASVREVEVPATYITITRQVVQTPGTGNGTIPAEYQTITKTILTAPASVREIEMPALMQTVTVKKCKKG
jgi:hypothetical protein